MMDDGEHDPPPDPADDTFDEGRRWDSASFLAGIALGAVLGGGLALLFAPTSGKKTRRLVRRQVKSLSRDVAGGYLSVRDETRMAIREKKEALRARLAEHVRGTEETAGR